MGRAGLGTLDQGCWAHKAWVGMWSYLHLQLLLHVRSSDLAPWQQEEGLGVGGVRGSCAIWGLATATFAWLDSAVRVHLHCMHLSGSHRHGNAENGAVSGQLEQSNKRRKWHF